MIVISPAEINDATLTATNVPESTTQEWAFDDTYELGSRVVRSYASEFTRRPPAGSGSNIYDAIGSDGGDVLIVVGSSSSPVQRSADKGVTWAEVTPAEANNWSAVAYGGGTWVAVSSGGTNRAMYSTDDGVSWTSSTPSSVQFRGLVFAAGLFVAVAQSGSGIETSPDGITWTPQTTSVPLRGWQDITHGDGLFVCVGSTGTGNRVMTSPDAITWTARSTPADNQWISVAHGGGEFVAVANFTGDQKVMTSPDGSAWTLRSDFSGGNTWKSIAYGNGEFIAVGSFGEPRVMRSRDLGVSWEALAIPDGYDQFNWSSITFTGDSFFSVRETSGNEIMGSEGIHSIYESLIGTNEENYPEDDDELAPVSWARVSATNRWAMFSDQLNDQTVRSGIEVEVTPGVEVDAIAFFNVDAETIQIVVDDGTERYNETITLEENFLIPGVRQDTLAVLDLPTGFPDSVITVTFVNTSGDAKCGRMILGSQRLLGVTSHGSSVGIIDYSTKQRDTFGNAVILERNFAKRGDFKTLVDTANASAVEQVLSSLRTTPTAYIADVNTPSTIIFGFYNDFEVTLQVNKSTLSMDVEGMAE